MKKLALALAACVLAVAASGPAAAQAWPSKPIKIFVPFAPAGAADIICRHLQQPLSELLGQPVVVENKSGGGGVTGTDALARSAPDGHTIGMIISSHASNVSLHQKLPYDSIKDFKPITIVSRSPNVLSVHPSLPYKSLDELIAAAKAKPGELVFATSGNGTAQHFAAEYLKLAKGIDMVHVPYRGAGPALNDLVGGQVKIGILNIASSLPHIQSGRIRPLAVTSAKRNPATPDVPSIAETVPGFDFAEWFALAAPGGTPDEIVEKLYVAIKTVASKPEMEEKFRAAGMVLDLNTPAEFRTLMDAEVKKFADLVKRANVKLE
jgi:tripartite-type tricarboxylate transporter receptor subunit TctC